MKNTTTVKSLATITQRVSKLRTFNIEKRWSGEAVTLEVHPESSEKQRNSLTKT